MLVDLQREIHMQNLETRLSKIKAKKKKQLMYGNFQIQIN